jgi:L-alanine-DL-glutamate epimerase-like enolase superfamily enzyme
MGSGMTAFHRRHFLKTASGLAAAAMPLLAAARASAAGRVKITEVKLVPLRVVRPVGTYPDFLGNPRVVNVGGGAFVEVHTDQGMVGIGPDMDPSLLPLVNAVLKGQDPFDINLLAARLYALPTGANTVATPVKFRGSASAEMAVWDLVGKIANQPLYKLWGGGRDRVTAYASMLRLSTPAERAEQAARQKAAGWKAFKLRAGFATMKEDIQLVEAVRKATGGDFVIMVDANKAILEYGTTKGVRWDFDRAAKTALAYQKLGVYWLEEPLLRADTDHLAELNAMISMNLAGGEGNRGIAEYRDLLEKHVFDIVQPEILIEGPCHLHKIAAMAEAMNRMCMPHQGDSRLATIATMHMVASWPEPVAPYFEIFNDQPIGDYTYPFEIFENPPVLGKDGAFALPQGPGLGVTIRDDMRA